MNAIVFHLYVSHSVSEAIKRSNNLGIEVISSREQQTIKSPKLGLAEGIIIIGAVKSIAELGKVILELVNLLRKDSTMNEIVRIELPNGNDAYIERSSDHKKVTRNILKIKSSSKKRHKR